MSIKVLIVDDSLAIRQAVRSCIESNTDWQVCGEAEDGKAAIDLVRRLNPDLLVLDLSMPVMNGLEAAREIAAIAPKTRIVLFTAHDCEQLLRDAQNVGIKAVLPKDGADALGRLLCALREATNEPLAA